jgi:hypothetical protein
MSTNTVNSQSIVTAAPANGNSDHNWFQAMAEAWGKALDAKANQIQATADKLNAGDDTPSTITQLSAQSLEMSFLSNSSHTAMNSVGTALETLARKQ